jgi:sugar phosphate isomerase/epimerase
MKLTKSDIQRVRQFQDEYGLNVSSLGSPIGKTKLKDVDDGTNNTYTPINKYLDEVKQACDLAHALETKLIRCFSFYPPKGASPKEYLTQSVEWLGRVAEVCHRSDLTFGLEVETNLVGHEGWILSEIHRLVNHPAMMLIFDGGNIVMQGYTTQEIYEQYEAMKSGIGWMHIKDFTDPHQHDKGGHVEEDKMKNFVPPDQGDSGHERILRDFAPSLPALEEKLKSRGIPGVFLDLEPHLKGGGQYGGFSGPDGMGVALRSLCRTLDFVGIAYHLRDFDDIRASRGF